MSSSSPYHADLASSFPALNPEISADVTSNLIAAVTGSGDASGEDDQFGRETTLIAEVDAFHPRDLEETVLVAQLLAAHHGAMTCFRAAGQCEVTGKEASGLRRDAIALQRSLIATLRALHKSQARPVSEDDLVPRPAVPIAAPRPADRAAVRPERSDLPARPRSAAPAARPAADGQQARHRHTSGPGSAPEGAADETAAAAGNERRCRRRSGCRAASGGSIRSKAIPTCSG